MADISLLSLTLFRMRRRTSRLMAHAIRMAMVIINNINTKIALGFISARICICKSNMLMSVLSYLVACSVLFSIAVISQGIMT